MIKVVLLSSMSSTHTVQWAKSLVAIGLDVVVISQHPITQPIPSSIKVYLLPYSGNKGYFLNALKAKKLIQRIKPDIVNAHYASGYGTLANLVNFHPYILSVWGSDINQFPNKSILHRTLIRSNLTRADAIAVTSNSLLNSVKRLCAKPIYLTPFGVDTSKFSPRLRSLPTSRICIGTVKSLKHVYGIDILLNALAILYHDLKINDLELSSRLYFRIVGSSTESDLEKLSDLAKKLKIDHITDFIPAVPHHNVPIELSKLDIFVALSREESFGVAVLEAQSMKIPVIVSNVGGLPEVVQENSTGYIVESNSPEEASQKMKYLIYNSKIRYDMGDKARVFVEENYSWNACAFKMFKLYQKVLSNSSQP